MNLQADAVTPIRTVADRRTRRLSPAGRASLALLAGVGAFQVALAAGAPWGAAAWGGAHPGVLPSQLRVGSAVSAVVYLALGAVVRSGVVGPSTRRRILTGAAALMLVGTLANLASPSMVEKAVWSPVAASLAVLLWRTRRDRDDARPTELGAAG